MSGGPFNPNNNQRDRLRMAISVSKNNLDAAMKEFEKENAWNFDSKHFMLQALLSVTSIHGDSMLVRQEQVARITPVNATSSVPNDSPFFPKQQHNPIWEPSRLQHPGNRAYGVPQRFVPNRQDDLRKYAVQRTNNSYSAQNNKLFSQGPPARDTSYSVQKSKTLHHWQPATQGLVQGHQKNYPYSSTSGYCEVCNLPEKTFPASTKKVNIFYPYLCLYCYLFEFF